MIALYIILNNLTYTIQFTKRFQRFQRFQEKNS